MQCPNCGYVALQVSDECVNCKAALPPPAVEDPLDETDFRRKVRRRERSQLGFPFPAEEAPAKVARDAAGKAARGAAGRKGEGFAFSADGENADPMRFETDTDVDGDADTQTGAFETDDESSFSSGTQWAEEETGEETWVEAYQRVAGFWPRAGAMLIDTAFFALLFAVLYFVLHRGGAGFSLQNPAYVPALVFLLILHGFYFSFFHAVFGQTPGKMVLNLRVVSVRGGTLLAPWDCFVRWIGYFASALPAGAGFFWVIVDADDRTWHDRWVKSAVVFEPVADAAEDEEENAESFENGEPGPDPESIPPTT
jgi:uncharacterized RDD family membrane protein YckC